MMCRWAPDRDKLAEPDRLADCSAILILLLVALAVLTPPALVVLLS